MKLINTSYGEQVTWETAILRSVRSLTGAEVDRLLHRYDLAPAVRDLIAQDEMDAAWAADEAYSEQMAEYGRAIRYYTRLEAHARRHPLQGCQPAPYGWASA